MLLRSHVPDARGGFSSDSLNIKQAEERKALAGDSVVPAVLKLSCAHVMARIRFISKDFFKLLK